MVLQPRCYTFLAFLPQINSFPFRSLDKRDIIGNEFGEGPEKHSFGRRPLADSPIIIPFLLFLCFTFVSQLSGQGVLKEWESISFFFSFLS